MATRKSTTSDFNKGVFTLLKKAYSVNPDGNISRLENILKIAKRVDHEVIITNAGPYLLKYADLIKNNNIEAFSTDTLQAELDKHPGNDHTQFVIDLFKSLKGALEKMKPEDRSLIFTGAKQLIVNYLDFAVACRTESK